MDFLLDFGSNPFFLIGLMSVKRIQHICRIVMILHVPLPQLHTWDLMGKRPVLENTCRSLLQADSKFTLGQRITG